MYWGSARSSHAALAQFRLQLIDKFKLIVDFMSYGTCGNQSGPNLICAAILVILVLASSPTQLRMEETGGNRPSTYLRRLTQCANISWRITAQIFKHPLRMLNEVEK